ncbi:MAG: ArsR/SmtB family transcription factor [Gemmatimonas sp.]
MIAETPLLTAIASPRRREILRLVWNSEQSAGDIARAMPDVTFGAVSLQLKALSSAGLVTMRAQQRHRYYLANRSALAPVAAMLERMWSDALWSLKLAAELEESRRGPKPVPRRAAKRGRPARRTASRTQRRSSSTAS